MKNQNLHAVILCALILGVAYVGAAWVQASSNRYDIVPAGSSASVYRIDKMTGELAWCNQSVGCRVVVEP